MCLYSIAVDKMSHQDWNPLVIGGGSAAPAAAKKATSKPKPSAEMIRLAKLDAHGTTDDVVKPKMLDPECKAAMIKARVDKKLTQKELNARLSLPPGTISSIESGHAVPSPGQMNTIGRELGIVLRYAK